MYIKTQDLGIKHGDLAKGIKIDLNQLRFTDDIVLINHDVGNRINHEFE